MRVDVWDGGGEKYLGQGDLVGNVDVFLFEMRDGSLSSEVACEEKPLAKLVASMEAEGAELEEWESVPKILLDSGGTVYGCQVWWTEAS